MSEPLFRSDEASGQAVQVDECPDCQQTGTYDARVHVGGRGIYRCPDGHIWQDASEKPDDKGYTPVGGTP